MTIYGLYERNGNRAGFWVQHRTWNNMCARVQSIDGPLAWDNPALHAKGAIAPAPGYRLQIVEIAVGRDGFDGDVRANRPKDEVIDETEEQEAQ